ncbi:DNA polymerase III subunit alpha [Rhizobium laguerreae]|uniref:DNA polymerase III subunit alpha n=1 Tax=Rhizobium laguerreae TaxID=1076926 RepID=UPI001C91721C|nr:DNA polymerase III subunit alpha [Rhizobium laguerreae]MBY3151242.1 DNA polymerase III subunit alpha [Rhizobium laguerreae]
MSEVFPFAHLHVHSDYTLSRGASKLKDLIKRSVELGLPAMALTDDNAMFGVMEYSKKAADEGLQPIPGVKVWLDCGKGDNDKAIRGSMILLAQDEVGYATICTLVSMTHRPHNGQSGITASVPLEIFETTDFSGVVMLTGGMDGFLRRMVAGGRKAEGEELLNWFRSMFDDRIYLEITRFGDETKSEIDVEQLLIDIAYNAPAVEGTDGVTRTGVPLIATTEVWYAKEYQHEAFEILKAVNSKTQITTGGDEGAIICKDSRRYHMRSAEEMRALFADLPEAFENACYLPKRMRFMVPDRKPILPPFPTEGGRSEDEELTAQAREGLNERLALSNISGDARKPYDERLEFELGIIMKMGFPGYFLIVSDFIKWAKRHGIPVGPGRGSGAGSLVAYSLKITNLDPLRFGLLFERFLNPERVSMPDFDVDFCQDRRDEVIQYVVEKYGIDLVSLIAAYGELKSKGAVSDVGRVMLSEEHGGYAFGEIKRITKVISMEGAIPATLKFSYEDKDNPTFKQVIDSEPKYKILYDNARKVEGLYRNLSTHAAGVVIGGRPLHELVPLAWDDKKQLPISQFNMKYTELSGLVKFDFLGLKTLSVIRETLLHIKETTGETIDLDVVPLDDKGTFEMLAKGFSNGVFQIESEGMKRVLADIKPTLIEDLIAVVSLYRPGPMEMIPHYADCKNGKATPDYPEPVERTKPFLEETFGIMVYQEQVMLVAQNVGGYTLGGADLLRRAMGKKDPAEMVKQREGFVIGAAKGFVDVEYSDGSTSNVHRGMRYPVEESPELMAVEDIMEKGYTLKAGNLKVSSVTPLNNGMPKEVAEALFDKIADFAGYGFNKSHAAAYALIAYHTAWLKHNYPAEFMAAMLTYETDDADRMAKFKEDMDIMGIPMLPPDMNRSFPRFKPERMEDGKLGVRFGFTAIKGISGGMEEFLAERRRGEFKEVEEFWTRCGNHFNKGQLEKLVEAGSFDSIHKNRHATWNVLSYLTSKVDKKASKEQTDLFGGTLAVQVPDEMVDKEKGRRVKLKEVAEWGNKVDRQFNAVGFYFADHPLDSYLGKLMKVNVKRKASFKAWMQEKGLESLKNKRLAGICEIVERRQSKNSGKYYVFAKFLEKADSFQCMFFADPEKVDQIVQKLESAKMGRRPLVVVVDLAIDAERDDMTMWGREVYDADELIADHRGNIHIVIDRDEVYPSPDEKSIHRAALEDLRQGRGTQKAAEAAEIKMKTMALQRKAREISALLQSMRADDNKNAIPISIQLVLGEDTTTVALQGRFLVDMAAENAIKAMDGVVSVAEDVTPAARSMAA